MALTLNGSTGEVFPSWTTAGRPATPTVSQTGYNSTLGILEFYNGTSWQPATSAVGTGGDAVFQLNGLTVTGSYTIPTGQSALSVGPITINSGQSVTVPANSRYVIL